ncbi:MAG: histidinol-phosphate transaminase [Bulleidia sp.]
MENKVRYEARAEGRIMLNANESPYTLPEDVMNQIMDVIRNIAFNRYPDNSQKKIRQAYAEVSGVSADQVIAGNGSDQLLGYLIGKFAGNGKLYTFDPDFSMYDYYASSYGAETVKYPCDEDGSLDIESFIRYGKDIEADLVVFSNPNNPSGHFLNIDEVERIVSAFSDVPVIVDEAYVEFADGESAVTLIDRYDNLYVTRTLSKAYGLAGLRTGFALGQEKNMVPLLQEYVPYALSTTAMETAAAVLADADRIRENVALIRAERARVYEVLSSMRKIRVYPSQANFIYGNSPYKAEMLEKLSEAGIVIRNYAGSDTFRVTIGSPQENDSFLAVMEQFEGE